MTMWQSENEHIEVKNFSFLWNSKKYCGTLQFRREIGGPRDDDFNVKATYAGFSEWKNLSSYSF